ncbi:MAG: sodium:alanine symporter family protein [Clostridia bacterium]|nr:sodium:alanine symporter family protein [Clostridia bacterium]
MLNHLLTLANTFLFGPGLTAVLLVSGLFFLIKLKPFFLTQPKKVLAAFRGSNSSDGGMPAAKAMTLALAGTLGVGNIAGVASAIAIGGAGAVFWMWVSAIAAMPVKYAEIVLAVKHRRRGMDKRWHGGAYYYIADRGGSGARFFALLFALLCLATSLTMGCAVQSSAVAQSLEETLHIPPMVSGILFGLAVLLVVSGGLQSIADLTVRLIPLMSGIYIVMSLCVILPNAGALGGILHRIVSDAFSAEAMGGGIIGFLTSRALRMGVTRGIVSNEAGCGTAPIAHASADVKHPAVQGLWGMFEVFADTIVICTLTAFVILLAEDAGVSPVADGMAAAGAAFGHFLPFAKPLLCAAILVFAFCTVVCWFHYGSESLAYITRSRRARTVYTLLYAVSVTLGALLSDGLVWSLADFTVSVMTAVNITALLLYAGEIKRETDNYFYPNAM